MEDKTNSEKTLKPGDKYDVSVEGSLGLLALGAVGLQAWRKKRHEAQKLNNKNKIKNKK